MSKYRIHTGYVKISYSYRSGFFLVTDPQVATVVIETAQLVLSEFKIILT